MKKSQRTSGRASPDAGGRFVAGSRRVLFVGLVTLLAAFLTPLSPIWIALAAAAFSLAVVAYHLWRRAPQCAQTDGSRSPGQCAAVDKPGHSEILGDLEHLKSLVRSAARVWGCSSKEVHTLELAAAVHDLGNIGVPDCILNKPGRLTEQEFEKVRPHASLSAAIAKAAHLPHAVSEIVLRHHERWDGSGYPGGLRGKQIPRLARMLTIVDCFNALVSDRPHRPALSTDGAVELMRNQGGRVFDPELLAVFLPALPAILSRAQEDAAVRDAQALSPESRLAHEPAARGFAETAQKDSIEKLTKAPGRLLAFYEILQVLGADLNFEKSLQSSLRILRQAVPCDRAGIFVLEQDQLVLLQGDGFPEHCVARLALAPGKGLMGNAQRLKKPMIADRAPAVGPDGRVPRYLDDVQSSLAAPLLANDEAIGSIVLCSKTPQRFRPEDAELLSLITGKIAATVLSSRRMRRIYLEAETDMITGLPNARAVFRKLDTELQRAGREGDTVAVLFLDMDGLKAVNDSHGHAAGDRLLTEAGRVLKTSLRPYDFLGRIGGDEFLAIIPGLDKDKLESKIQALKKAIEGRPLPIGQGAEVCTSVSIGAAVYPADATEAEELVYLSDRHMYLDKHQTKPPTSSPHLGSPLSRL